MFDSVGFKDLCVVTAQLKIVFTILSLENNFDVKNILEFFSD